MKNQTQNCQEKLLKEIWKELQFLQAKVSVEQNCQHKHQNTQLSKSKLEKSSGLTKHQSFPSISTATESCWGHSHTLNR